MFAHHRSQYRTGHHSTGSGKIIAGDAITADAYASALNIMQPERGIEWINELDGIEALSRRILTG